METKSSEDTLIYTQSYTVRIHEINAAKLLTIPALLKLMQETSMQHLIALQASTWHLQEKNLGWVLLRQRLDILRHMAYGEKVTVVTYPTGFDKFFGYRDYLVFDADKKLAATSSTMWSLIDTESRKIARVPEELRSLAAPTGIKLLPRPTAKTALPSGMEMKAQHSVHHYDLDWNNHVNNAILAQHMLATLIKDADSEANVKSVTLHYKNESGFGDQLHAYASVDGNISKLLLGEKIVAVAQVSS